MNKAHEHVWTGVSGIGYRFAVYAIGDPVDEFELGVYVFSRKLPEGWEAVLVGEGELKVEIDYRINEHRVIDKSATHVHVHHERDPQRRSSIVADLLGKHIEAFEPAGCNSLL